MFATTFLTLAAAYLAIGLVCAVLFVLRGVAAVDHAAKAAPWSFKILIIPGVAALWPHMIAQWLRVPDGGKEA